MVKKIELDTTSAMVVVPPRLREVFSLIEDINETKAVLQTKLLRLESLVNTDKVRRLPSQTVLQLMAGAEKAARSMPSSPKKRKTKKLPGKSHRTPRAQLAARQTVLIQEVRALPEGEALRHEVRKAPSGPGQKYPPELRVRMRTFVRTHFDPKNLERGYTVFAKALGVSQNSIRRWWDDKLDAQA